MFVVGNGFDIWIPAGATVPAFAALFRGGAFVTDRRGIFNDRTAMLPAFRRGFVDHGCAVSQDRVFR